MPARDTPFSYFQELMVSHNVLSRFWPAGFGFFAAGALGVPSPADSPSMSLTSFADAMMMDSMEDCKFRAFADEPSSRLVLRPDVLVVAGGEAGALRDLGVNERQGQQT
jgi:hypothetical protein